MQNESTQFDRDAVLVRPLPRLMRALEAVAPLAQHDGVSFVAQGGELTVSARFLRHEISVVMPGTQGSVSLRLGYDDLMGVMLPLAAEYGDAATDTRVVAIGQGTSPIEADGLAVSVIKLSPDESPYDAYEALAVTVARDELVRALPAHLALQHGLLPWTTHLRLAFTAGEVEVATRDRLVTTLATMKAQTDGMTSPSQVLDLWAPLVVGVAQHWEAETVEIGWQHYAGGSSVFMRCGDVTLRTFTVPACATTGRHVAFANSAVSHKRASFSRLDLLEALDRFREGYSVTRSTDPVVLLTSATPTSVTAVPVIAGTPSVEEGKAIEAIVGDPARFPAVHVQASRLTHALRQLDTDRVVLRVRGALEPIELIEARKSSDATSRRHVLIEQLAD
jgi:hypothetical protein